MKQWGGASCFMQTYGGHCVWKNAFNALDQVPICLKKKSKEHLVFLEKDP